MTLQEIQYKAQGIIHKWRDDDSAPYIEFVEELAHMIVPEPSKDLEEAAHLFSQSPEPLYSPGHRFHWDDDALFGKQIETTFIAGAKWQAEQLLKSSPLPEDTVIYQKGVEEGKRLMMEEAVEGYVNYYEDSGGILMAEAQVGCPYHNGDKVRIIVLPKED